jgi:hypothetical protein
MNWFRTCLAAVSLLIAAVCANVALAAAIPALFNTGVDNSGTPLPNDPNAVDPHYAIVVNAAGTGTAAHVVDQTNFPFGLWIPNTPTSKWIAPAFSPPWVPGDYMYELTFDLSGLDPGTASITGRWSTDNGKIGIFLNGSLVVGPPNIDPDWSAFVPFSIPPGSPFHAGINSLDFKLNNSGLSTGLHVTDLQGNAALVPEPCALVMLAAGAVGLLIYVWRRRKRACS